MPSHALHLNCLPHAMSSRSLRIKIAAGALALAFVLTVFVVVRFAGASAQSERIALNFPSLMLLPLVALPFLPDLLEP